MAIGTPVGLGSESDGSGSSTCAIFIGVGIPAGALIFVNAVSEDGTPDNITSCADASGNTYTPLTQVGTGASPPLKMRGFYCKNALAVSAFTSITVTYSGTTSAKFAVAVYVTGLDTSAPFDQQGATGQTNSATSISSATGILAQADEIVLGCNQFYGAAIAANQGTFTLRQDNNPTGVGSDQCAISSLLVAATTAVTYAPSWVPNGNRAALGYAVAFKGAVTANVGAAAGTSTVTGVGASAIASAGAAAGTSTVTGSGQISTASVNIGTIGFDPITRDAAWFDPITANAAWFDDDLVDAAGASGAGAATGVSTVAAVGASAVAEPGSAAGTSTVLGVGASTVVAVGSASGSSAAAGVGAKRADGVGSASGTSTTGGVGVSSAGSAGASTGTSVLAATSVAAVASVGSASGVGSLSAEGSSTEVSATGGLTMDRRRRRGGR